MLGNGSGTSHRAPAGEARWRRRSTATRPSWAQRCERGTGVPESRGEVGVQDPEHHDGARDTRWRDDRMTGRRSHGRLSALNGVVHQGKLPPEFRSRFRQPPCVTRCLPRLYDARRHPPRYRYPGLGAKTGATPLKSGLVRPGGRVWLHAAVAARGVAPVEGVPAGRLTATVHGGGRVGAIRRQRPIWTPRGRSCRQGHPSDAGRRLYRKSPARHDGRRLCGGSQCPPCGGDPRQQVHCLSGRGSGAAPSHPQKLHIGLISPPTPRQPFP